MSEISFDLSGNSFTLCRTQAQLMDIAHYMSLDFELRSYIRCTNDNGLHQDPRPLIREGWESLEQKKKKINDWVLGMPQQPRDVIAADG